MSSTEFDLFITVAGINLMADAVTNGTALPITSVRLYAIPSDSAYAAFIPSSSSPALPGLIASGLAVEKMRKAPDRICEQPGAENGVLVRTDFCPWTMDADGTILGNGEDGVVGGGWFVRAAGYWYVNGGTETLVAVQKIQSSYVSEELAEGFALSVSVDGVFLLATDPSQSITINPGAGLVTAIEMQEEIDARVAADLAETAARLAQYANHISTGAHDIGAFKGDITQGTFDTSVTPNVWRYGKLNQRPDYVAADVDFGNGDVATYSSYNIMRPGLVLGDWDTVGSVRVGDVLRVYHKILALNLNSSTSFIDFEGSLIRTAGATISGNATYSGGNTFTGTNQFSGADRHDGGESHHGNESHYGHDTHSGNEVHSGHEVFTGQTDLHGYVRINCDDLTGDANDNTIACRIDGRLQIDGNLNVGSGYMTLGDSEIYQLDSTDAAGTNPYAVFGTGFGIGALVFMRVGSMVDGEFVTSSSELWFHFNDQNNGWTKVAG